MSSIIEEKYLNVYLEYFNRSKNKFQKNRWLLAIGLSLVFSMFILLSGIIIYMASIPLIFYLGYKIPYFLLSAEKKESDLKVSYMFPHFLDTFISLLPTSGNIYQNLKKCITYTHENMRDKLEEIVEKIEVENKREHYIEFADYVGSDEAYMIMDMIYQFSEYGVKKDSLIELKSYIKNLKENQTNKLITEKLKKAEKWGYTPIFISMFFIIGFAAMVFVHYFQYVVDALNF